MTAASDFEIFLSCPPGLEEVLRDEVRAAGFKKPKTTAGGVTITGGWPDVWRANLELRGPSRIIARIASFRASELYELDKRARKVPWSSVLRAGVPVRVEASCRKSKIYHSGAAAERVARAIREELGATISDDAHVKIRARIENDIVTIGVDTSGELLHKRGFKEAVNIAPMRENMAALLLRACHYDGRETVLDPMCGSGTFVIEAAEIAAGLKPGRARRFAFEDLATFDSKAWHAMTVKSQGTQPDERFYGSDRDAGAIRISRENAERARVSAWTTFEQRTVSETIPPPGAPGLVIANPPYGDRIGDKKRISPLYRTLGDTLRTRFSGWRAAIITTDAALAKSTGLPFDKPLGPIAHGGLRVWLWQTGPLP